MGCFELRDGGRIQKAPELGILPPSLNSFKPEGLVSRSNYELDNVGIRIRIEIADDVELGSPQCLEELIGGSGSRICSDPDMQSSYAVDKRNLANFLDIPATRSDRLPKLVRVFQRFRIAVNGTD